MTEQVYDPEERYLILALQNNNDLYEFSALRVKGDYSSHKYIYYQFGDFDHMLISHLLERKRKKNKKIDAINRHIKAMIKLKRQAMN